MESNLMSSWKCVANKQKHFNLVMRYSAIDHESPNPSYLQITAESKDIRRSTSTQLIDHHKRLFVALLKDCTRLNHFTHESGDALQLHVSSTYTGIHVLE